MKKKPPKRAMIFRMVVLIVLAAAMFTLLTARPAERRDLWLVTATLRETVTTSAHGNWKITTPNTTPSKLFPMKEITIEKQNKKEFHKAGFAAVTAVMENEGGDGVLVFSGLEPVFLQVGGSIDESSNTETLEYGNGELGRGSKRDIRGCHIRLSEGSVQMEWSEEVKFIGIGSWGKGTATTRFEKFDPAAGGWKISSYQSERSDGFNIGAGQDHEGSSYSKHGDIYTFSTLLPKTKRLPKDGDYDESVVTSERVFTATVRPYNPPEVRILMSRDGQDEDITDRRVEVIAGEIIDLKTLVLPEGKKEEGPRQWTIAGGGSEKNYLKKFEADKTHGRVLYPEKADLEQKTLVFHWSGGKNGSVTYSTTVEGEAAGARASFSIRKPQVRLTVNPAPASHLKKLDKGAALDGAECWVTGAYSSATSHGVQYDGIRFNCEPLDAKTPGTYQWVQLIKKESSRQKYDNGAWADFVIGDALDICYPYQSGLEARDAPAIVLPTDKDRQGMVFFSKTQTNRMFLMFKPDGRDSEWVPLQFIAWEWQGAAQYYDSAADPHWEMEDSATNEPQGVTPEPTDSYPEWTKNSGDPAPYRQNDK